MITPAQTANAKVRNGSIGMIASVANETASASAAIEIARLARGTAARIADERSLRPASCQIRPTMNRL
jgi:hypothetical protein